MVAVVMFFAFSCLFTLSPANMAEAKARRIFQCFLIWLTSCKP